MRTIKESLLNRLAAQAAEADLQGLTKVASSLEDQVGLHCENVRSNDASYHYASESFQQDLNNQLWAAIVRIADFHDINHFDGDKVQKLVDATAESLVLNLCTQAGVIGGVSPYEDRLPGEKFGRVEIEIKD